jgi:hypothetical protein
MLLDTKTVPDTKVQDTMIPDEIFTSTDDQMVKAANYQSDYQKYEDNPDNE